jgi:lipoic acid synthetase
VLKTGCDLLTIGQYLAPSKKHIPVVVYIHPDVFAQLKTEGEEMGFKYVASGPLVRSSYLADKAFEVISKE